MRRENICRNPKTRVLTLKTAGVSYLDMPSRSHIQTKPEVARLGDLAAVIPGVFSLAKPVAGESSGPITMVTVRWLSAATEPLPTLYVGRVSDLRADRYRVRTGDVVIPSRSTSIRVAVVPEELDGTVFNSTLLAIRCSDRVLPSLLAAYLTHPDGASHILAASQSGTAQMNLNATALSEIPVPLVPMGRQHELAGLLEASDYVVRSARDAADLRHRIALDLVISSMTGRMLTHA